MGEEGNTDFQKVKVSYMVGNYPKFLIGELVREDKDIVVVRGLKDNAIFEIKRDTIVELVRLTNSDEIHTGEGK